MWRMRPSWRMPARASPTSGMKKHDTAAPCSTVGTTNVQMSTCVLKCERIHATMAKMTSEVVGSRPQGQSTLGVNRAGLVLGLLLGAPGGAIQKPTLYTSALAEMSNIVVSSYVGGVAAAVGLTLVPSIPHVGSGTLAETMQAAFGDLDSALLLVTDLRLPGVRYAGRIVATPVEESLSRLLSMLGVV